MSDSVTECVCGTDVRLYLEREELDGRIWPVFRGSCPMCHRSYSEVTPNLRKDYAEAKAKVEEETARAAREERIRAEEEMMADMSPKELLEYLGPDRYPWFYAYVGDKPVKAGTRIAMLTLESAAQTATAIAKPGDWISVYQKGELVDRWQDGTRPELRRIHIHTRFTYHSMEEDRDMEGTKHIVCGSEEQAHGIIEGERRNHRGFAYTITDDEGSILEVGQ